jgi:NADH-quinone oxidoreductase subunit M
MLGVFMALDVLLFYVMWEVMLVPMYFIIGIWGGERRIYASVKFFIYTMIGSLLMLVGILYIWHKGGQTSFNYESFLAVPLDARAAMLLFFAFFLAFAVKVPMFPFHTWLPDAHVEAPTAGSIILAGVLLKLGTYGFLRFGLYLFPEASVYFAPLLITLGVIGIIYGAIVATMQKDLKRVVAYSSVAHLGFIAMGIFAITTQSVQGSVLQMINHGISTPALFLLVGFIYERRHTRLFSELRGIQKSAPILAAVFIFVVFSSIGLPGLNGFAGEFLILTGTFLTHRWFAVVAATGVILAALYLLWAFQRAFHGMPDEANANVADLNWKEGLVMLPLLAIILFTGIYPKPLLSRMEPSVNHLIRHVEVHSHYRQPPVAVVGPAVVAAPAQGGGK